MRQLLEIYGSPLSTRGGRRSLGSIDRLQEAVIMNVIYPNTTLSMNQAERLKKDVMYAKVQTLNKEGKLWQVTSRNAMYFSAFDPCFKIYQTEKNFLFIICVFFL